MFDYCRRWMKVYKEQFEETGPFNTLIIEGTIIKEGSSEANKTIASYGVVDSGTFMTFNQ